MFVVTLALCGKKGKVIDEDPGRDRIYSDQIMKGLLLLVYFNYFRGKWSHTFSIIV